MTGIANIIFADAFFEALAGLSPGEIRQVSSKLQLLAEKPDHPSFRWHRLDRTADESIWSGYVNKDLRIIATNYKGAWVLLYVGHHDDAYRWARDHAVQEHRETGELIIYRVIKEPIVVPVQPYLKYCVEEYLLSLGVPESYLKPLCLAETEDQFLDIISGLPTFVQERLIEVSTGNLVPPPPKLGTLVDVLNHPPARQHLVFLKNLDELEQALNYPWEKWLVFLHPYQREAVERVYKGPFLLTGAAGTGKTVVGLHRTKVMVERYPQQPVLLTTFNRALAIYLQRNLQKLLPKVPPVVIVENLHYLATRLYGQVFGKADLLSQEEVRGRLAKFWEGLSFDPEFLFLEFQLWDAFGLYRWEDYRAFPRLGRKIPLNARQRQQLHEVFQRAMASWEEEGKITFNRMLHRVREAVEAGQIPRYRVVIADEVQDFGPAELLLLRSLATDEPDSLFLAMDPAQRIYQFAFPWSALGIDVRGRSMRLKVNYRLSREVTELAEKLATRDDSQEEVLSLLRGPTPQAIPCKDNDEALKELRKWLWWLRDQGYSLKEVAVLARSKERLEEVKAGLKDSFALRLNVADEDQDGIYVGTVHSAKGREFRAVAVYGASDADFPFRLIADRLQNDEAREDFLQRERNLLYVALTRAREHLLVLWWGRPSPFLPEGGWGEKAKSHRE